MLIDVIVGDEPFVFIDFSLLLQLERPRKKPFTLSLQKVRVCVPEVKRGEDWLVLIVAVTQLNREMLQETVTVIGKSHGLLQRPRNGASDLEG